MAEWGVVKVGLPEEITDLAEIIDSFAQALLAILNIALAILQVVKAFLIGFLDPLAAIVQAIINEIEGFLNDLRQIGLYVSGDLNPEYPFNDLLGGYTAYERRMIGRLVDRSDPTRPDFTPASVVVAVFLYTSVNTSDLNRLISFIQKVLLFFGQRKDFKQFTVPVDLEATYGTDGASLATFGPLLSTSAQDNTPDTVNIRWRMAPPPSAPPVSWALPSPKGFLVEVSTIQNGLLLAWDIPTKNAQLDDNGNQARTSGVILDPTGVPLRLYGGVDQIDYDGVDMATQGLQSNGDAKPGGSRVFGFKDSNDNVPIPIEQLRDGDKYILQRTFYVDASDQNILTGPGQGFSITLKAEDMPYEANFTQSGKDINLEIESEPAKTVFVRVAAVSGAITSETDFKWSITEQLITSKGQSSLPVIVDASDDLSYTDRGETSTPLTVTFPASDTVEYLETITAALAVLLLSRSDLVTVDDATLTSATEQEAVVQEAQADVASARFDVASATALADGTTETSAAVEAAERTLTQAQITLSQEQAILNELLPFVQDTGRQSTGLEEIAPFLMPLLVGPNPAAFFGKMLVQPTESRSDILRRCRAVANKIYRDSGNLGDLQSIVIDSGEVLRTFLWSEFNSAYPEQTLLESLSPENDASCLLYSGVSLNPYAIGIDGQMDGIIPVLPRLPGFRESSEFDSTATEFQEGAGSADMSPTVYVRNGPQVQQMDYIRNLFFQRPEIYTAAVTVLGVAAAPTTLVRPPGEGAWLAYRLLPQGLPAIEQFLDDVLGFLKSIQAGIDSIVDVILAYINLIEARILELQALINRINNLIQSLALFDIPAASGLVLVTQGTDGVVGELVTSENKPLDSAEAYGGGVVILSGGLNSSLAALLQAFFGAA